MPKKSDFCVPSFLTIKAKQIHDWAENNTDARHLLPVLLRKLIHSTAGHGLRPVDFPGYDNAERKGWDGRVEADKATLWIPEGKSCWEFSTEKKASNKADLDYKARLRSVSPAERAECTFVFVTTRNWQGKTTWKNHKHSEGKWKAVRVLDASDLEQWLEVSIPVRMWLAEQLGRQVTGFKTLDQHKREWEEASNPPMKPVLFEPSITAYRQKFKDWLGKPSERPFVVAADSRDEALAFLAYLFNDTAKQSDAVVFESAQMLWTLAASPAPFIPIVCTEETDRELATVLATGCRHLHCISIRLRNVIDSKPDIELDLLDHNTFKKALAEMGITGDRVEQLAKESGRSPTILRRRLSMSEAIRKPQWARDVRIARSLIPMALVGAWCAKSKADREVISTLADRPYHRTEVDVAHLLQVEDSPVWSVGKYRGVASKMDAMFAINKWVIEKDLLDFLSCAKHVLSESDPALELPENERWMAGVYGKVRAHSAALRKDICETLVILSVHGNNLFQHRLDIDVDVRVSLLIRKLLTPLSLDKLLSHNEDLPFYAEAAPDEFLNLIEEDLRQPQPVVLGLLKPADSGLFGSPTRTGLLWALECLAWKHLGRVSLILAQLSRTVINDNWVNTPIGCLASIYRSWLPQTAAPLADRLKALEKLTKQFPDIGWQICMAQLHVGPQWALYNYQPRWRSDASGAGQGVKPEEREEFKRKALDLAFTWPKHDQKTLGDLVEQLPGILEEDQTSVWDLIDKWANSKADENAKACLREQIRRFAFTRLSRRHKLKDASKARARESRKKLRPRDLIVRHAWLFAQDRVPAPDDKSKDKKFNPTKDDAKILKLRTKAMQEIWTKRGFEGVSSLLSLSEAPGTVGYSLGSCITDTNTRADFLQRCLALTGDMERKSDLCMWGFLNSLSNKARGTILSTVTEGMAADQIARVLRCTPCRPDTWRRLDQHGKEVRKLYWREVSPYQYRHRKAELSEIIDRLLEAKRPRAAFHAVCLYWPQIETSRLKRLLRDVATVDAEPDGQYMPESHYLSEALRSLNGRPGVRPDEMAKFEFMFLGTLERSEYGIPNLEQQIAESPNTFFQLLAYASKREDDGQEPIKDPKLRAGLVSRAFRLLDRIRLIPGKGQDGKVNVKTLRAWITKMRKLSARHGRVEIGDVEIGRLLSKAPPEENGSWPCLPVCEVMERVASPEIDRGFEIGTCNSRGVVTRTLEEGGDQERELATQYRDWAKLRESDYPFVSSVLERIADGYDRDARMWDNEMKTRKRLHE